MKKFRSKYLFALIGMCAIFTILLCSVPASTTTDNLSSGQKGYYSALEYEKWFCPGDYALAEQLAAERNPTADYTITWVKKYESSVANWKLEHPGITPDKYDDSVIETFLQFKQQAQDEAKALGFYPG